MTASLPTQVRQQLLLQQTVQRPSLVLMIESSDGFFAVREERVKFLRAHDDYGDWPEENFNLCGLKIGDKLLRIQSMLP